MSGFGLAAFTSGGSTHRIERPARWQSALRKTRDLDALLDLVL